MAIGRNRHIADFQFRGTSHDRTAKNRWKQLISGSDRRVADQRMLADLADDILTGSITICPCGQVIDAEHVRLCDVADLAVLDVDHDLLWTDRQWDDAWASIESQLDDLATIDLGFEPDDFRPEPMTDDDVVAAVAYEAAGWGDVLEIASLTPEYVGNDGFIVTYGDFYRRGESRTR